MRCTGIVGPEEPVEQKINGLKMAGFTIKKIQLTPLQEGTSSYVDNVVQYLRKKTWSWPIFSVQVSNEPVTVEVKPCLYKGNRSSFQALWATTV